MAITKRDIWGEHGAWAIVLTAWSAGLIVGRPPVSAGLLLLPAVFFFTAGKGIAQKARRSGRSIGLLAAFGFLGALCSVPAALAAPPVFIAVAFATIPFLVIYFFFADQPAVTRALGVELYGVFVLASVAMLVIAASHPRRTSAAVLAWPLFALLFTPGVVRARLLKKKTAALKAAVMVIAALGAAIVVVYVIQGRLAAWTLPAVLVFVEDVVNAVRNPHWTTRRLGVTLTIKNAAAALLLAAGWIGVGG